MTDELMEVPSGLPVPSDLHPKFKALIDISKYPNKVVLMNYDTGNLKLTRPSVAAQATAARDYQETKQKVFALPTWFQLTYQEAHVLFPLWCNFLHYDWKSFNALERSRDMSGVEELPEDVKTIEDLRFITDDSKRDRYRKALENRAGAGKAIKLAKEMRAMADEYCRPTTISTNDFASLEYYRKAKVGFLLQYAHDRRRLRDEAAIIEREEKAIAEEMIKEKARGIAGERVKKQKVSKSKAPTKAKVAKKKTKRTKNAKAKVGA